MKLRYQPKKRLSLTFLLSFSLLVCGLLLFAMIQPLPASPVLNVLSVLGYGMFVLSFLILWRFGMVSYEYYVVENIVYVVRLIGRKRCVVCDLSLTCIRDIDHVPDGSRLRISGKITRCFNYTVSPLNRETMQICYGTDEAHLHLLILQYHKNFCDDLRSLLYTNVSERIE